MLIPCLLFDCFLLFGFGFVVVGGWRESGGWNGSTRFSGGILEMVLVEACWCCPGTLNLCFDGYFLVSSQDET